jgi:hypothetical protein
MIASSDSNSIFFKDLSGTYPNARNTLHATIKYSGKQTILYNQKFPKDHTVYLQFESDFADQLTLKAYSGLTEIESFTNAYVSSYGSGANIRYYTNFTIVLDSIYYEKQIWFKVTQTGSNPWTSEPIFTTNMTDPVTGKLDKLYRIVKYTNLSRMDSDLSSVFIDWLNIPSTGNYMDFFVEVIDNEPNDTDESEILEGSQSESMLSSVNFKGRIFKTGPIPEYMCDKIAVVSNLSVFTVNDIEYIKKGGTNRPPFGSSTLYQLDMKLTQKNAIAINVDALGAAVTPVTPPISGTPMYIGSVTSVAPDETEVKTITSQAAEKVDQTKVYTITDARFCFAYPTSFGALSSILDNAGDEIISGFNVTTLTFTIGADSISFDIYTLKSLTSVTSYSIQYKW